MPYGQKAREITQDKTNLKLPDLRPPGTYTNGDWQAGE